MTYAANRVVDLRKPAKPQVGSAADVLANGEAVRAEVLRFAPYHVKSSDGSDVYLVTLAVTPPSGPT